MSAPIDRRIHARVSFERGSVVIVRYERAGKWFREGPGFREPLTVDQAAQEAALWLLDGGVIHYGLPGGSTFDRKARIAGIRVDNDGSLP